LFQEIWDFYLILSDWSVSNVMKEENEDFDPSLHFRLETYNFLKPTLRTRVLKGELNPQWPEIEGGMNFRGTLHELEHLRLEITLYNSSKIVGSRRVQLTGIADQGTIKADIVQKGRHSTGHVCFAKGRVQIMSMPKYRQLGEVMHLSSKEQYLCVKVLRIDNLLKSTEYGVVNSFLTCEWGNQVRTSSTCYDSVKPIYNETFHFPIIIKSKDKANRLKRNKTIMKQLGQRNSVQFCVWSTDEEGFNDSLGSAVFPLSEMQSGSQSEVHFYDDDFNSYSFYKVKVKSAKKQLTSPFVTGLTSSNIFFEVYLLYEHESDIVFEDIPVWQDKEEQFLDAEQLREAEHQWLDKSQTQRDYFAEETRRFFKYSESDERGHDHFLPFYLCKMSLPDIPTDKFLKKFRQLKQKFQEEIDEEKLRQERIKYLPTRSLKAIAHWTSLVPFAQNAFSDVWTSPEFLMRMGKGDVEEHALMLACLFLGYRKHSEETEYMRPKARLRQLRSEDRVDSSLQDKRVYVVVGTLKLRKTKHIWVMTIDEDFRGVTFWETTTNESYHLRCRVQDPEALKEFCRGGVWKNSLLKQRTKTKVEEVENDSKDNVSIDFSLESDEDGEESQDEDDKANGPNEQFVKKKELGPWFSRMDLKYLGRTKKAEETTVPDQFIDSKKRKDMTDQAKYSENLHQPRMLEEANEVDLPYRTIDIVFNHTNVFMNLQHFDPTKILYDIEDATMWHPFLKSPVNSRPFYSSPSFSPPMSYMIADKLQIRVIKDIKKGVSALRSGNNQGTSWKPQSDKVVRMLEDLLVLAEQEARADIQADDIREKHRLWISEMRLLMPEGYRFSAKPAHFNYPEPERIRNVLLDEGKAFFKVRARQIEHENTKFAIGVKVFPYVGHIVSIRVVVAVFYPKPLGVR
jgi:hypothetical protein